jgi:hypothetical protein
VNRKFQLRGSRASGSTRRRVEKIAIKHREQAPRLMRSWAALSCPPEPNEEGRAEP